MKVHIFFGMIAATALAFGARPSFADLPAVPGHAIVARSEGDALVIWDATLVVASIVKDRIADADAKELLERDALIEMLLAQSKLQKVSSISVRIVYLKTGDVSPVYGAPTFQGVERYATVSLSAADVRSDRDKWREIAAGPGAIPNWVTVNVSGTLPQR